MPRMGGLGMPFLNRLWVVGLVLLTAGCAAKMNPALPDHVEWVKPKEGQKTQVTIGDTVLTAGNAVQAQVIAVPHAVVVAGYQIPPGDYRVISISENGAEFHARLAPGLVTPTKGQQVSNVLFGQPSASSRTNLIWKKDSQGIPSLCLAGCVNVPSSKVEWVDQETFERRLVFSGFEGRTLHMEYREFQNDRARPAFSTPMRFDLSRGRVVDVKGARIEVLGINARALQFRVLEPFRESDPVAERRGRRAVNVPASRAR